MQVKILGTAAGGGFPQWNCACPNCDAVRKDKFQGSARLQTQISISGDGSSWFLVGASPDLRSQIELSPELHPKFGTRSSPIQGVVLASADLDHVLGLLLLRELQPFHVFAAEPVIQILREENSMFRMLNRVADQVRWNTICSGHEISLDASASEGHRIECMPVALSSRQPAYSTRKHQSKEAVLGFVLKAASGRTLGFFPQLPRLDSELIALFATLDCLLLDGTFWSEDELFRLQGSGQTASEMGHIPVDSERGTLRQLAGLTKTRKMYIHINNTNPMLNEAGPEYRKVLDSGWELAKDGCHFNL